MAHGYPHARVRQSLWVIQALLSSYQKRGYELSGIHFKLFKYGQWIPACASKTKPVGNTSPPFALPEARLQALLSSYQKRGYELSGIHFKLFKYGQWIPACASKTNMAHGYPHARVRQTWPMDTRMRQ
jgi:hypothetical protein